MVLAAVVRLEAELAMESAPTACKKEKGGPVQHISGGCRCRGSYRLGQLPTFLLLENIGVKHKRVGDEQVRD
jgi:hypothetical protein